MAAWQHQDCLGLENDMHEWAKVLPAHAIPVLHAGAWECLK